MAHMQFTIIMVLNSFVYIKHLSVLTFPGDLFQNENSVEKVLKMHDCYIHDSVL